MAASIGGSHGSKQPTLPTEPMTAIKLQAACYAHNCMSTPCHLQLRIATHLLIAHSSKYAETFDLARTSSRRSCGPVAGWASLSAIFWLIMVLAACLVKALASPRGTPNVTNRSSCAGVICKTTRQTQHVTVKRESLHLAC